MTIVVTHVSMVKHLTPLTIEVLVLFRRLVRLWPVWCKCVSASGEVGAIRSLIIISVLAKVFGGYYRDFFNSALSICS